MQTPGFYFQLGGHGAMIAGGAYQPDTAHRDRIRAAIAERGEVLEAALADPAVAELLKANIEDYRSLSARNMKMPKLVMKGAKTLHGLARSTEQFIEFMATTLEIR
jgi:hypothetical protein